MKIGQAVQYVANETKDGRIVRAAIIVNIIDAAIGHLTLAVFSNSAKMFPGYDVTRVPTTKVQHYWQYIPEDGDEES